MQLDDRTNVPYDREARAKFWSDVHMGSSTYQEKIGLVSRFFTPASPVSTKELFCGRQYQIQRGLDGINDPGRHVILYGHAGVGKTSLANLLELLVNQLSVRISCVRNESFSELWGRALKKARIPLEQNDPGKGDEENPLWDEVFRDDESGEIKPNTLCDGLALQSLPILFVFDEFDKVANDSKTREKFSDTLKLLSDSHPGITILLVGIADNIGQLIAAHQSVERCMAQVRLTLMSDDDLAEIVQKGFSSLEIDIDNEKFTKTVVSLSQGFPHYTHSLCKHAAIAAIRIAQRENIPADRIVCEEGILTIAVDDTVSDAFETVQEAYRKAISSQKKDNRYKSVLLACAIAPTDEYYTFRKTDLVEPMSRIECKEVSVGGFTHHIAELCEDRRGSVLKKIGTKNQYRYGFRDPMVRAFTLLKAYQDSHPELKDFLLQYANRR